MLKVSVTDCFVLYYDYKIRMNMLLFICLVFINSHFCHHHIQWCNELFFFKRVRWIINIHCVFIHEWSQQPLQVLLPTLLLLIELHWHEPIYSHIIGLICTISDLKPIINKYSSLTCKEMFLLCPTISAYAK